MFFILAHNIFDYPSYFAILIFGTLTFYAGGVFAAGQAVSDALD